MKIIDTTLRDGSHAVRHSFTQDIVRKAAAGLDSAGCSMIEISHGDGLGGSSFQYGKSLVDEKILIEAGACAATGADICTLYIPGIGTSDDLQEARKKGAGAVRIAVHSTEAKMAVSSIKEAKAMGFKTCGFLMMCHMPQPQELAGQAALMEQAGADFVYMADSAGALVPSGAAARVKAVRQSVSVPVGFHAHNNLGLAVGNSLAAADAGAAYLDASLGGLGAGAGNAAHEVLAAALDKAGYQTGENIFLLMDLAEEILGAFGRAPGVDKDALVLGYAGVYSSFLLHARSAADRYGLDAREVLLEIGRRRAVGGQEDQILDAARELSERRKLNNPPGIP